MKILGIDPGSRNLGYCIVDAVGVNISLVEAGLLKFKGVSLQEKMIELSAGLDVIMEANFIDEVAIEDIFFAFNPNSVLKLAQFRGAIAMKILQAKGNFYEYTPLQVKKSVTGNGKATKEQVAFMVKKILKINKEIKPLDITDAMAVAITHSQRVIARKGV